MLKIKIIVKRLAHSILWFDNFTRDSESKKYLVYSEENHFRYQDNIVKMSRMMIDHGESLQQSTRKM